MTSVRKRIHVWNLNINQRYKAMKIIFLISLVLYSVACSFKSIYFKPAIKGQIIDQETNQPISNKGYIASFLEDNNKNAVKTDANGYFYLKNVTDDSVINLNSSQKFQSIPQEIYIYISGYEYKTFDFSKFPKKPENGGMYVKSEVDVGKIYLNKDR